MHGAAVDLKTPGLAKLAVLAPVSFVQASNQHGEFIMSYRIRTSRIIEKADTKVPGRTWYSQAVTVDQFPHASATIWERALDPQYLHPVGVFHADAYFVNNEYTTKDGRTVREVKIRFTNLKAVEA